MDKLEQAREALTAEQIAKLITDLRCGASTSTDVGVHLRKYQALCDRAAEALATLSRPVEGVKAWALVLDGEVISTTHDERTANYMRESNRNGSVVPLAIATVEGVKGEPRVKPLEWERRGKSEDWFADAEVGRYEVGLVHHRYVMTLRRISDGQWEDTRFTCGSGVEAAKAAAQADYERRILSALASSEAEARLRERVETWWIGRRAGEPTKATRIPRIAEIWREQGAYVIEAHAPAEARLAQAEDGGDNG